MRALTHQELSQSAGRLAPFFTLLAQVLETPMVSDPRRELRSHGGEVYPVFSSSPPQPPSLSSLPSSPVQPPRKKQRPDHSSESYIPSEPSDQSSHDLRRKPEITTNACIYELLRCVTELYREDSSPLVHLEWSITHDTFSVQAGELLYTTTNDGSLVHRGCRDGYWQRVSEYSYCSIEVGVPKMFMQSTNAARQSKSWYNIDKKPLEVQAQEAAHLIGMYAQHAHRSHQDSTV